MDGSSEKSGEGESNQSSENKQEVTITKMEKDLIVNNTQDVNWKFIQGETEVIYSTWATIVLDLHSIGADSNKIVEFSNTLDEALISIQEQDKAKAAQSFAKLYSFLPEFLNTTKVGEFKKNLIQTKSQVLNAYSYMTGEDIQGVKNEIQNAENTFIKIVNNISKENEQRRFNINKAYILIEELKNSISEEKSEIFYLKYKNLMEELNALM